MVDVVVTHLAMTVPEQLRAAAKVSSGVVLRRESSTDAPDLAAQLYRLVGREYHWLDRLVWTRAQWCESLDRPTVELWTAREGDTITGYFELEFRPDAAEIRYFGLVPGFLGRGLGGWLLTEAVRRAWQGGATEVIVNTCTLDGTAALPNYLARGFTVMKEVHQRREVSA